MSDKYYNVKRSESEVIIMGKVGHPPVENPRNRRVTIRLTQEEYARVARYNELHDQSISETMLEALEYFFKSKKARS